MNEPLSMLAADAAGCTRCRLAQTRTQVVFGVGNPEADLLFIGEAPGFHEDKQGEPFVGAAGQLLTRMLTEVVGVGREDVYICNVLKCRPPGNRDPQDDEIEACTPWLIEQVSLIQPRVIATLGNFATKFVLNTQQGITRLRGASYPWHGRTVIPTFHPAAILRSGGEGSRQFGDFRDDFELIRDTLASDAPTSAPPPTVAPAPEPAVGPDPPVEAPAIVTVPPSLPQDQPVPEGQLELF
jgi:DNA polymerase